MFSYNKKNKKHEQNLKLFSLFSLKTYFSVNFCKLDIVT